jgi:hypothetical protein
VREQHGERTRSGPACGLWPVARGRGRGRGRGLVASGSLPVLGCACASRRCWGAAGSLLLGRAGRAGSRWSLPVAAGASSPTPATLTPAKPSPDSIACSHLDSRQPKRSSPTFEPQRLLILFPPPSLSHAPPVPPNLPHALFVPSHKAYSVQYLFVERAVRAEAVASFCRLLLPGLTSVASVKATKRSWSRHPRTPNIRSHFHTRGQSPQ